MFFLTLHISFRPPKMNSTAIVTDSYVKIFGQQKSRSFLFPATLMQYEAKNSPIKYQTAIALAKELGIDYRILLNEYTAFLDYPFAIVTDSYVKIFGQQKSRSFLC